MKGGRVLYPKRWIRNGSGVIAATISLLVSYAFCANTANFDTAWTFVYDGGKTTAGKLLQDKFSDVAILPNGDVLCVGEAQDSASFMSVFAVTLSPTGKESRKRWFKFSHETAANSLLRTKKGNYVIGGVRYSSPLLLIIDTALNLKTSAWYYDSTNKRDFLSRPATINSMIEADDGRIIATGGDAFPEGINPNNYAAYLEFDSNGVEVRMNEFVNTTGYEIAGWSIAPSPTGGGVLLGGRQSLFKIDSTSNLAYKRQYSFSLPGVGIEINNVSRIHRLRSGPLMVVGQSYEEDCWTRYNRLSYDAWWTPLSGSGTADARYTAGVSGQNDYLFDFTQLVDGRIAFVGGKGTVADSGLWVFVTDSTGKTLQWEKQYNLPGLVNGTTRSNLLPLSIAATPDSGFIVVGMEGSFNLNANAFAFKFVPKPLPVSNRLIKGSAARAKFSNNGWTFSFETRRAADVDLLLYTVRGKSAGRYSRHVPEAGRGEIQVNSGELKKGLYFWELRVDGQSSKGVSVFAE
jgi:hypothetical protein